MLELARGEDLSRFVDQVRRNLERRNLPPPLPERILLERGLRRRLEEAVPEPTRDLGELGIAVPYLSPCEGLRRFGGQIVTVNLLVAAGTTQVRSTDIMPFPFLITHLHLQTNTTADAFLWRVVVATDVVRAAGGDESGLPVIPSYSEDASLEFSGSTQVHDYYPNFLNVEKNRTIKFIFQNTSGVGHTISAQAEFIRLG